MNDDVVNQAYLLESGSDNSWDMFTALSYYDSNTDSSEQEEQEVDISSTDVILQDIYTELVDIHADILVLNDSVNNVSQCVADLGGAVIEFFIIFIVMVLIGTVFNNLLHFFK